MSKDVSKTHSDAYDGAKQAVAVNKWGKWPTEALINKLYRAHNRYAAEGPTHMNVALCEALYDELKSRGVEV